MSRHPVVRRSALALLFCALLAACDREVAQANLARSDAPRRIDVLFLNNADSTHSAPDFASALAPALGRHGINMHFSTDGTELDERGLGLVDAVVVYASLNISAAQKRALRNFVATGGGLVAIHAMSGAERDAISELVGEALPPHALTPVIDTASLTKNSGRGRIAYMASGHSVSTLEDTTFQRSIINAVVWAVGDKVRAQWQAYAVPPLQYTEPPVLIPNYENRATPPLLQSPLSPAEALKQWQVPPGFAMQLFAWEPEIVNPIAMTWDERGRLWVVETVDYPNNIRPDGQGNDVIRILEDTNGDGRADKSTVFADKLSIPTGIAFAKGGVIVSNAPRFLFLQDTTHDDRADVRRETITGWSVADTHGGPSNLQYGFDNWIWGAVGDAGFDGMISGKRMKFEDAIYRFRPDGSELEIVARFTNNTWGLGFSEANDVFANTANNEHSVFVAIPNRYFDGVTTLRGGGKARIDGHYARRPIAFTRQVDYFGGFTAAGGHNLYTARSFPREYWNRVAFVHEAIGGLVHRAVIERAGSGFREVDGWNLVASADEWAAPVHAQVGPDGAVWIIDWYSFIKQHNPTPPGFQTGAGAAYETPLRDKQRGRIYRLVWKGAPAYKPLALSADRPSELVKALRHDNMFWRMTAQRLLVDRGKDDVLPDLYRLIADRHVDEIGLNNAAVHAIWTLHGLGALNGSNERANRAVVRALTHPSASVRKNAVMALPKNAGTMQDIVRANLLHDSDANVKLHALLAVADLPAADAIGRELFALGSDSTLLRDQWLPTALFLAARKHTNGFLAAYRDKVGAVEFARLEGLAAGGQLEQIVNWSAPDLNDANWDTVRVPAHWTTTKLAHFPGVVWFRTALDLPASATNRAATLHLGPISDIDVSYVNGIRVGSMDNVPGERRAYAVPAGTLRPGRNVIAVEVTNQRRGGGIYGTADSVFIIGTGFKVPLAGNWKYRKAAEWIGGRAPDFSPTVAFGQQFLRLYNTAGTAISDSATAIEPNAVVPLAGVPGQNKFDRTVITVRAGQRVGFAFNNADGMSHNVVVLNASRRQQEVGALLNEYVSDAAAAGRDFIPPQLPVLARSAMVSARQLDTLVFNAPAQPGDYPYLCTVPGHWLTMWGILRVTR